MPAFALSERQQGKIKGRSLLQLSTILESADTNLITTVPFLHWSAAAGYKSISKVTLLKALKNSLFSSFSMLLVPAILSVESVSKEQ